MTRVLSDSYLNGGSDGSYSRTVRVEVSLLCYRDSVIEKNFLNQKERNYIYTSLNKYSTLLDREKLHKCCF